jgi:predicted  nucleic acid-binding Zn-ribbon protein
MKKTAIIMLLLSGFTQTHSITDVEIKTITIGGITVAIDDLKNSLSTSNEDLTNILKTLPTVSGIITEIRNMIPELIKKSSELKKQLDSSPLPTTLETSMNDLEKQGNALSEKIETLVSTVSQI